jgi:uncharacterized protein YpuA (DUF1002 family)
MKRFLCILPVVLFIMISSETKVVTGAALGSSLAGDKIAGDQVVTLGADLTDAQKEQIMDLFDVKEDVRVIQVTNSQERIYLEGLVDEGRIGTKAISSVYVKPLDKGSGIDIETYNIDWVTGEMYANAAVTAGVEDARIIVAAPFEVSGTAALTGIMKAFEESSGKKINEAAKKTANRELVITGDLGDKFGKDKSAELMRRIKERVIQENAHDPEEIKKIIIEIKSDLNINLNEEQIDKIADLMSNIKNLDLDINSLKKQLDNLAARTDTIKEAIDENKGLIQRILESIQSFFEWLMSLFT